MSKFSVGDRVRVYGVQQVMQMDGVVSRIVKDATMIEFTADEDLFYSRGPYLVHPKQCRRLIKKQKCPHCERMTSAKDWVFGSCESCWKEPVKLEPDNTATMTDGMCTVCETFSRLCFGVCADCAIRKQEKIQILDEIVQAMPLSPSAMAKAEAVTQLVHEGKITSPQDYVAALIGEEWPSVKFGTPPAAGPGNADLGVDEYPAEATRLGRGLQTHVCGVCREDLPGPGLLGHVCAHVKLGTPPAAGPGIVDGTNKKKVKKKFYQPLSASSVVPGALHPVQVLYPDKSRNELRDSGGYIQVTAWIEHEIEVDADE